MLLDTSMKKINDKLIVSLKADLSDRDLGIMVGEVINKVDSEGVDGVVIDFSMIRVITAYSYDIFMNMTKAIRLMGSDVVWVSLRPGVVVSLIDLDLVDSMANIRTSMTVEQGILLLEKGV